MTQPTPPGALGVPVLDRVAVADYPTYREAQRAVDFLSDNAFPVQRSSIIGSDLRMVENVLGRLTRGRAAGAGAASGAWFGLLFGVLLSLFAREGDSAGLILVQCLLLGVVFGAVFGFAAHAATRGQRDFTSRSAIVASRYEVQVDREVEDDARNLLIKLAWRTG